MSQHTLFRRAVAGAALCIAISLAAPSWAGEQSEAPTGRAPGEVIEETTRRVLELFRNLVGAIPQYEAPVVLDNGDILIKRKRTDPEVPAPRDEGPTRTRA